MTAGSRDWDCRCDPPVVNGGPSGTAAAYCWGCLGWTKRPTKAGTISEIQRRFFLRFRGTPMALLNPLTREAMEKALAHAEAETKPRIVKEYRGRKRLKDGCSKGHASWAWVKGKDGYGRCKLCERERSRKSSASRNEASETLALEASRKAFPAVSYKVPEAGQVVPGRVTNSTGLKRGGSQRKNNPGR